MKSLIILAVLVAAAVAVPVSGDDRDAQITNLDINVDPLNYKFGYGTSNGISAQEEGAVKNVGSEDEAASVRGEYSYTGPDGVTYKVTYIADENGYQPQGAHLPQA